MASETRQNSIAVAEAVSENNSSEIYVNIMNAAISD